jgi:tetratricopeptide (TPR) repeat protein
MAIDLASKSVLIIDDMPSMCAYIKVIVQSLGAKDIDMAYRAQDALHRVAAKDYDIILCDYYLGEGLNGQHILEQGKALGHIKPRTAFVMITAENSRTGVLGTLENRPDGYLLKPFKSEGMANILEKIVSHKEDIEKINQSVERGNIDRAILGCDEKVKANPAKTMEYLKLKTGLLIESGRHAEAREVLEPILSEKRLPWASIGMAKALFQAKEYAEAQAILEETIGKNPNYVECFDWLAKIHLALDHPAEAQRMLEAGTKISPRSVPRMRSLAALALNNSDFATAMRSYGELLILSKHLPQGEEGDVLEFAEALSRRGQDQEARNVLKAAKAANAKLPATPLDLLKIALIHTKAAHKDKKPALVVAHFNEAKKYYRAAGGMAGSEEATELARCCLMAGDAEEAKRLAETLLKKAASDVQDRLRAVFELFGQGEAFQDAQVMASGDPVAINRRGVDLFERKRHREAMELFERASTALPDDVSIALNAVQAMVALMRKSGSNDGLVLRARVLLERAGKGKANVGDSRHMRLSGMLDELARKPR